MRMGKLRSLSGPCYERPQILVQSIHVLLQSQWPSIKRQKIDKYRKIERSPTAVPLRAVAQGASTTTSPRDRTDTYPKPVEKRVRKTHATHLAQGATTMNLKDEHYLTVNCRKTMQMPLTSLRLARLSPAAFSPAPPPSLHPPLCEIYPRLCLLLLLHRRRPRDCSRLHLDRCCRRVWLCGANIMLLTVVSIELC